MIGRVSHYYGEADREPLNRLKHDLYELVAELKSVLERPEAAPLLEQVEAIFGQERLAPYLGQWEATRFLQDSKSEIDDSAREPRRLTSTRRSRASAGARTPRSSS